MSAVKPGNVRKALRDRSDLLSEKIADRLEKALDAQGTKSVDIQCKSCYEVRSYKVPVDDDRTAIQAAKELIELGYGRSTQEPQEDTATSEAHSMTDEELERRRVKWLEARGYVVTKT